MSHGHRRRVRIARCLIAYQEGLHDRHDDMDDDTSATPLARLYERLVAMGVKGYHVERFEWTRQSMMRGGVKMVLPIPKLKEEGQMRMEVRHLLAREGHDVDFVLYMDKSCWGGMVRDELRKRNAAITKQNQANSGVQGKKFILPKCEVFLTATDGLILRGGGIFDPRTL